MSKLQSVTGVRPRGPLILYRFHVVQLTIDSIKSLCQQFLVYNVCTTLYMDRDDGEEGIVGVPLLLFVMYIE